VLHNEQRSLAEVFREAWRKGDARVRLARHHGLHELIHMLPGLFCLYLVIASLAVAIRPDLVLIASVPAALYGVVLAILAIQAGWTLRSPVATFAVPVYVAAMHLGYGMGYWAAWIATIRSPRSPAAPD
jgi:hypothetical protein